jgi:predicted PurR-regulated permease PerM
LRKRIASAPEIDGSLPPACSSPTEDPAVADRRAPASAADPYRLTFLIFAIIAFLYFTGEVLKPLALAVLLSFALAPAVRFLERRGLPRVMAVLLTGLLTMGFLGSVGVVVGRQLTALANGLPNYQENIENKLAHILKPAQFSAAGRLEAFANRVTAKLETPAPPREPARTGPDDGENPSKSPAPAPIPKVQVVSQPSFQERLRAVAGPYLETLGVGSFVLVLVVFMLMGREDLSDRIVSLFGHQQVSLTTRTMEELGNRISRYLATLAFVNTGFGLVIGLGLLAIGVPYAVMWGTLAALLRFIPYVGPAVAFVLPLVFSFAYFPGWIQAVEVVGLFAVVEVALNSFLEPVIYGKTTGVSALSLLVSAMFWTWLWGTMGLLLSTPLTLCLAVLGKYIPSLSFFVKLLGEEAQLEPHVRFYQRIVALDRTGAMAIVEEALKERPRVEVYDLIVIPAMVQAERDAARDDLEEQEEAFALQVVGDVVDKLEGVPDLSLEAMTSKLAEEATERQPAAIVGVAVSDPADTLVSRMLAQVLAPSGCTLDILTDVELPLQVAEQVAARAPQLVVVSHVPPDGLNQARYLVRRIRALSDERPVVVGHWSETRGAAAAAERLVKDGASHVVFTLEGARDRILKTVFRPVEPAGSSGVLTASRPGLP